MLDFDIGLLQAPGGNPVVARNVKLEVDFNARRLPEVGGQEPQPFDHTFVNDGRKLFHLRARQFLVQPAIVANPAAPGCPKSPCRAPQSRLSEAPGRLFSAGKKTVRWAARPQETVRDPGQGCEHPNTYRKLCDSADCDILFRIGTVFATQRSDVG